MSTKTHNNEFNGSGEMPDFALLTLRIPVERKTAFSKLCAARGTLMSRAVRRFIEQEIANASDEGMK